MENNSKFRNHASIILEKSIKVIGTTIVVFLLNILSDLKEVGMSTTDILWLVGVVTVILVVVLGYQAIIWSKTYISIEENTLVIERNTINRKRNTIGLRNVSNVNLEQNLLEMILGTCKVKLDTNSLSTADETDVNIVLKKADAEKFRALVLAKAEGRDVIEETQSEDMAREAAEDKADGIQGCMSDILLHGVFSLRITSFVILVILIAAGSGILQDLGLDATEEVFAELFGSLIAVLWFSVMLIWGMAKEFFKYLNFRISRKKDKVYLSYGLFKKVAYSVPVDKINGIRLSQTPIARMGKRYMVEIINVGMDDDETEANTFFLPYNKIETIEAQLHMLLPEFDGALEIKEEKQPKVIWLLSLPWLALYLLIAGVAYWAVGTYASDTSFKEAVLVAAAVVLAWRTITKLAGFLTKGIKVDEKFLKIVDGKFARRLLFVKYDKIQYVTGNQCILAKHFKIQKGTISLLASLKNRMHELPYFNENDMELLKKELI